MPRKDEIPATGDMPQPPARRIDATEKARQMMQPDTPPPAAPAEQGEEADILAFKKVTTRIPLEQFQWLKEEVKQYRKRNPKAPRVTIEGLMMVAIDHLKDAKNLDSVIVKYRS
jgi:hypothetical protein